MLQFRTSRETRKNPTQFITNNIHSGWKNTTGLSIINSILQIFIINYQDTMILTEPFWMTEEEQKTNFIDNGAKLPHTVKEKSYMPTNSVVEFEPTWQTKFMFIVASEHSCKFRNKRLWSL